MQTTRLVLRICTQRGRRLYGGWWSCCLSRGCGSRIPNRIGWGMGFSKFEESGKHTMLLSDLSLYGSLSRCSGLSRSMLMNVSLKLLMPLTKIYIQTMNITVITVTHLCVLLPYLSMLDDSRPSSQNNQHSSRVRLTSDVSGHTDSAVGRSSSLIERGCAAESRIFCKSSAGTIQSLSAILTSDVVELLHDTQHISPARRHPCFSRATV